MANSTYKASDFCVAVLTDQIDNLAYIQKINDDLEDWYHNKIGHLRDIFDIVIPHLMEEKGSLWTPEAKEIILAQSGKATDKLDQVRVKPKPYEADGMSAIRDSLVVIEKTLIQNMADGLKECECPG